MRITIDLSEKSYNIEIQKGNIKKIKDFWNIDRKVLIVTDEGVPKEYAEIVASQVKTPTIVTLPQGEDTKCLENFSYLLEIMVVKGFTRSDAVIAVGGGVIGDLAGFAAAAYMRGIDFYNIPTTLLSQVDSSIGGKVAIDFCGFKNIVGFFYQPKGVIIDPDLLKTLDKRQFSAGMAEAVKMALTFDKSLFELIENGVDDTNLETVIEKSLLIKKNVVEQDEKEKGLRRILNFGHTLGHAIEAEGELLHGECVALGMIAMSSDEVKKRLIPVLKNLSLPYEFNYDIKTLLPSVLHDKKADGSEIYLIKCDKIGSYREEKVDISSVNEG